ncbi:hypothetical protein ACH5RR_034102 [Cinchona calisaya]|uniref:Aminotransferase-like plant mobile domain-containing protein n=1 Tax=Cinchona calisaya TaxID=153742 RepID=A0ABD2Y9X3_9GENT
MRGSSADMGDSFPEVVVGRVVVAKFGLIMDYLPQTGRDKKFPSTLAERWWDMTSTFHLSFGEVTLTPTEICIGGLPISWDFKIRDKEDYILDQQEIIPRLVAGDAMRVTDIVDEFKSKTIYETDVTQEGLLNMEINHDVYCKGTIGVIFVNNIQAYESQDQETTEECCIIAAKNMGLLLSVTRFMMKLSMKQPSTYQIKLTLLPPKLISLSD